MDRLSIRAKLTAAFAAAMIVVLVLAALFVYAQVSSDLNESLDENLRSRADDVAVAGGEHRQGRSELERPAAGRGRGRLLAQVLTPAGVAWSRPHCRPDPRSASTLPRSSAAAEQ